MKSINSRNLRQNAYSLQQKPQGKYKEQKPENKHVVFCQLAAKGSGKKAEAHIERYDVPDESSDAHEKNCSFQVLKCSHSTVFLNKW